MASKQLSKYERAQARVAAIRGFYNHLGAYLVVNAALLIMKHKITFVLISKGALGDPEFLKWIDWNVYGTPIVWGVVLIIHGIKVFGNLSLYSKRWEQKQLEKFMKEEDQTNKWE